MGTIRRLNITMIAIATILAIFAAQPSVSRSVNISSSWLLPQNDFPVFYRHFRDRVTWFEADAVCQFHHAQLATVESNSQFEAIRSYLKELDVSENVWIGLKRNSEASEFTWTNYQPLARSGYFREEVQRSLDPVCVVTDPTANFKWHSLHCGGPEVASFVCELPVPYWASKSNGCMTNTMEGMTVTFLPERPAIQLTKECSPGVSKNVTCNGNMKQSEILEQLSCPNKLLMTLIKTYNPIITDVKLRTTTSSSEADIEDYAIEMATIYNDETIQSISKAMERSADGLGNLPQEMSIAQEPIKVPGRNIFDTNGIDSAFHRSIDRSRTTTTTRIPSTTFDHTTTDHTTTSSTTTGRTTIGSTTITTTNTTSTTTTSPPSTTDDVTTSTVVTGTRTQPKRTALDADITYAVTVASRPSPQNVADNVTTSAASTSATTTDTGKLTAIHAATEVPTISSSSTLVKVVSTSTSQPTIALNSPIATATVLTSTSTTTTTTVGNGGHHKHHHHFSSTTAKSPVIEKFPIVAEKIPTTEKIPTPQKVRAPSISTAGIPAANASTVIAVTRSPVTSTVKIPYTVATARIPTAAKATIQMPTIHVYKKIELPPKATDSSSGHEHFPYRTANHTGAARKPSETATGNTVITTDSTAMNSTTTATGLIVKTATVVAAQPTATTIRAYVTIASAAPNNETSATASAVSGGALDDNTWNPTPSSPPSTAAVDTTVSVTNTAAASFTDTAAVSATDTAADSATDASAIDTTTATATATDTPAAATAAAITSYPPPFTTSPSSTTVPPSASPLSTSSTTAATATAATATAATATAATATSTTTTATSTTTVNTNHRKASSYDAYTDHPNRSRHIIRPKQHHHSYPYILYRLLG